MGLPWMAAEKPGSCREEALAWAYHLPLGSWGEGGEGSEIQGSLGPEHRVEMRGEELGAPELAALESQTRIILRSL